MIARCSEANGASLNATRFRNDFANDAVRSENQAVHCDGAIDRTVDAAQRFQHLQHDFSRGLKLPLMLGLEPAFFDDERCRAIIECFEKFAVGVTEDRSTGVHVKLHVKSGAPGVIKTGSHHVAPFRTVWEDESARIGGTDWLPPGESNKDANRRFD